MKLHLPLCLLAALVACLSSEQVFANNLTSTSTTVANNEQIVSVSEGRTYSGAIFTFLPTATYNGSGVTSEYVANGQGYNIAGTADNNTAKWSFFSRFNADGTAGSVYGSRQNASEDSLGDPFWHNFFQNGGTGSHGHTLRLASNAEDMTNSGESAGGTVKIGIDLSLLAFGGLIVEATDVNWQVGRNNGSGTMHLKGKDAVNLTIASNTNLNASGGIVVDTGGAWEVAAGKALTFNQAATISNNAAVAISRLSGDTNGTVTFSKGLTLGASAGMTINEGMIVNVGTNGAGVINGADDSVIALKEGGSLSGSLSGGTLMANGGSLGNFTLNGATINFGEFTDVDASAARLNATGAVTLTSGAFSVDLSNYTGLPSGENTSSITLLSGNSVSLGQSSDWDSFSLNGHTLSVSEGHGHTTLDIGGVYYNALLGLSDNSMTLSLSAIQKLTWGGANGTWEAGSDDGWSSTTPFTNGLAVDFIANDATATVTIEGAVSPSAIVVEENGKYIFTSTEGGTGTITGDLLMEIKGTVTMALANEGMSGIIDIASGGRLNVGTEGALGSAEVSLSGGTLAIDVADTKTMTLASELSGTGALTKDGTGTLNLAHENTRFEGTLSLNAGVVKVSANGALGSAETTLNGSKLVFDDGNADSTTNFTYGQKLTVNTASTLEVAEGDTLTMSGAIAFTHDLTKTGAGAMTFSGSKDSGSARFIVDAGTLKIGSAAALNGVHYQVNQGATLDILGYDNGADTWTLTLNEGAKLASSQKVGEMTTNHRGLGTFNLAGNATVDTGSDIFMVGAGHAETHLNLENHTLTKTGTATFLLLNTVVDASEGATLLIEQGVVEFRHNKNAKERLNSNLAVVVNDGAFEVKNYGSEVTRTNTIASLTGTGGEFRIDQYNTVVIANATGGYAGDLKGAGTLEIAGGKQTLSGASAAYTGNVNVTGGELEIKHGGNRAFTTGSISVSAGATLSLAASDALGWGGASSPSAINLTGAADQEATLAITGRQTLGSTINLNGNTRISSVEDGSLNPVATEAVPMIFINASNSNNTIEVDLLLRDVLTLHVNESGSLNLTGGIRQYINGNNQEEGTGLLTKSGSGTLTFAAVDVADSEVKHGLTVTAGEVINNRTLAITTLDIDANASFTNNSALTLSGTTTIDGVLTLGTGSSLAAGEGNFSLTVGESGKLVVSDLSVLGESTQGYSAGANGYLLDTYTLVGGITGTATASGNVTIGTGEDAPSYALQTADGKVTFAINQDGSYHVREGAVAFADAKDAESLVLSGGTLTVGAKENVTQEIKVTADSFITGAAKADDVHAGISGGLKFEGEGGNVTIDSLATEPSAAGHGTFFSLSGDVDLGGKNLIINSGVTRLGNINPNVLTDDFTFKAGNIVVNKGATLEVFRDGGIIESGVALNGGTLRIQQVNGNGTEDLAFGTLTVNALENDADAYSVLSRSSWGKATSFTALSGAGNLKITDGGETSFDSVSGFTGKLLHESGTTNFTGDVSLSNSLTVSGGTMKVDGKLTLTSDATLSGGKLTASQGVEVGSNAKLTVTAQQDDLALYLNGGSLIVNGTSLASTSSITLGTKAADGSITTGSGVLTASNSALYSKIGGKGDLTLRGGDQAAHVYGNISHEGKLTMDAGTVNLGNDYAGTMTVKNKGDVEVTGSAVTLYGDVTADGTARGSVLANSGDVNISGGSLTMKQNSVISNSQDVNVSGGSLTVEENATVASTGSINVTGTGELTVKAGATVSSAVKAGDALTIGANATYSNVKVTASEVTTLEGFSSGAVSNANLILAGDYQVSNVSFTDSEINVNEGTLTLNAAVLNNTALKVAEGAVVAASGDAPLAVAAGSSVTVSLDTKSAATVEVVNNSTSFTGADGVELTYTLISTDQLKGLGMGAGSSLTLSLTGAKIVDEMLAKGTNVAIRFDEFASSLAGRSATLNSFSLESTLLAAGHEIAGFTAGDSTVVYITSGAAAVTPDNPSQQIPEPTTATLSLLALAALAARRRRK